jgi:hypothetical protein
MASEISKEAVESMRDALEPFATFGLTDDPAESDIRDDLMSDRVCDWFGPSDFDAARLAYARHTAPDPSPSQSDEERTLELLALLWLPTKCCLLSAGAREWRGCDPQCKCPPSNQLTDALAFAAAVRAEATLAERERQCSWVREIMDRYHNDGINVNSAIMSGGGKPTPDPAEAVRANEEATAIPHAVIARASKLIQEWEEEPGAPLVPLIKELFALFADFKGNGS